MTTINIDKIEKAKKTLLAREIKEPVFIVEDGKTYRVMPPPKWVGELMAIGISVTFGAWGKELIE